MPIHYTIEMFRFGGKRPAYTKRIVQQHLIKVERHHLQPLVYTKCLAQHSVNDFPGHPALIQNAFPDVTFDFWPHTESLKPSDVYNMWSQTFTLTSTCRFAKIPNWWFMICTLERAFCKRKGSSFHRPSVNGYLMGNMIPVSYTHLTLPTKLEV